MLAVFTGADAGFRFTEVQRADGWTPAAGGRADLLDL
jgi:hypothetical protein